MGLMVLPNSGHDLLLALWLRNTLGSARIPFSVVGMNPRWLCAILFTV